MKDRAKSVVVAIDGPSASGKSTVSRRVAEVMQFVYVDSGGLYRGMTWKALRAGVDTQSQDAVVDMMLHADWHFFVREQVARFTIDGVDPGTELRSQNVRENVSDIAAMPEVRAFIVARLQDMAQFGHIVMEGRDIGSVVFPETPYKYYLDADPEERARRRYRELVKMEGRGDVEEVMNSLRRRDRKDTTRKTAPLQIPLGARVINSTAMSIEEVVTVITHDLRSNGITV